MNCRALKFTDLGCGEVALVHMFALKCMQMVVMLLILMADFLLTWMPSVNEMGSLSTRNS